MPLKKCFGVVGISLKNTSLLNSIELADTSNTFVSCLVTTVVDELHPAPIAAGHKVEEADNHVADGRQVMNGPPVAVDAQARVDAVRDFALSDTNAVHGNPAQQKYVEPDVEDPNHVEVVVFAADAIVDPGTVSFVAVDATVANVTVYCASRLDYLAVGTQMLAGYLLEEFLHFELWSWVRFNVARVAFNDCNKRDEQLDADH